MSCLKRCNAKQRLHILIDNLFLAGKKIPVTDTTVFLCFFSSVISGVDVIWESYLTAILYPNSDLRKKSVSSP